VEPGNSRFEGEGWSRVAKLIALAKLAPEPCVSQQRRERIIQQILARVQQNREQRRVRRAFVAGAAAILLLGLALKLASVGMPWLRSPDEMADKAVPRRPSTQ
jgi:hypothetical protein